MLIELLQMAERMCEAIDRHETVRVFEGVLYVRAKGW